MKQRLQRVVLLMLALMLPGVVMSQNLTDNYSFTTGVDSTKWVQLPSTATQLIGPGLGDNPGSFVAPIGFPFVFGDGCYTLFSVNDDGTLRLGSTLAEVAHDYVGPLDSSLTYNLPKINGFGHDGYMNGQSYVKSYSGLVAGVDMLIVEYALSVYDHQEQLLRFQIQLNSQTHSVTLVYEPADSANFPLDEYQIGMATTTEDVAYIDVETNTVSWLNGACPSYSNANTWPEAWRYYTFTPNTVGCYLPTEVVLSSVTDFSATFAFNSNALVSAEYGDADFIAGNGTTVTGGSTGTMVIGSLLQNTHYRADFTFTCIDGSTTTNSITFRTLAEPVSEFPYFTGFEEDDDLGWFFENGPNGWYIDSATARTGERSLYISEDSGAVCSYNGYNTSNSYAWRLVHFSEVGQYALLYDWMCYGESSYDYMHVYLTPSTAEYSTATSYGTSTVPAGWLNLGINPANGNGWLNLSNTWQQNIAIFNITEADTGYYNVLFFWHNDASVMNQPPAQVDNVEIRRITCPQPYNVEVTDIDSMSATVSWSTLGEETEWLVMVNDSAIIVSEQTLALTDLDANTYYNISVYAICGADDTSFATSSAFRTDCGATALPYFENFETATVGEFIPCWDYEMLASGSATTVPRVYNYSSYASSGTNTLYLYYSALVKMPKIFQMPVSELELSFHSYTSSSDYILEVGVVDDSGFFVIDTFTNADNGMQTVYFDQYTGDGQTIAFRNTNRNGYSYAYVYLDDILLRAAPPCHTPSHVMVDSVTYDAASISWDSNGAVAWEIEYGEAGFEPGTGTIITASENHVDITGLQDGKQYTYYLKCTSEDGDGYENSYNFITLAFPVEEFPYATSFEDEEDRGWALANGTNGWYIDSADSQTGSYALYISGDGGNTTNYAASTSYSYASRGLHITERGNYETYFSWRCQGESSFDYLRAFLVPGLYQFSGNENLGITSYSTSTPQDWIELGQYLGEPRLNLNATWQEAEGVIPIGVENSEYDTGYYQLVFYWRNDGSGQYAPAAVVDDIWFGIPSCPRIYNVIVDTVTPTDITLSWSAGGGESLWDIMIDDSVVTQVTSPTVTLSSLSPFTIYNIGIRAVCDEEDMSRIVTTSVRTTCYPTPVPYYENFDSITTLTGNTYILPDCWTYSMVALYSSNYVDPMVYNYSNYASSGDYTLRMYYSAIVSSPIFDTPVQQLQLDFNLYQSSDVYNLVVGVIEGNTFVPIDTIHNPQTGVSLPQTLYFADYTGNSRTIAFYNYNTNGSSYSYNYLDDIAVTFAPSCIPPTRVRTDSLAYDAARISWRANGSTAWTVEYGPTGFTPGSGTSVAVTTPSVTITGLTEQTVYDVIITANCGSDNSPAVTYSFRTRSTPVTVFPYITGFEPNDDLGWDFSNGVNGWTYGTAISNDGSYAMYISDDGTSLSYTNTTSYSFATRDVIITDTGDYFISYDWICAGESSFDYGRAMIAPASAIIIPSSDNGITYSSTPDDWLNIGGTVSDIRMNLSPTWNTYEEIINLDTSRLGLNTLVFFWRNDGSVQNIPPLAIDNFVFGKIDCHSPSIVSVDSTSGTSATISWRRGGEESEWEVFVNNVSVGTTTDTSYIINGLENLTAYRVKVRGICGEGDTAFYFRRASFRTDMCDNPDEANNFLTAAYATESYYSPLGYSFYNYSYTQMIVDASDLASLEGNDISAFAFLPVDIEAGSYFTNMDVYMANVADSTLDDGFILPSDEVEFVPVITDGNFNYTDVNWQIFSFDTVFTWDGHSNILFAVNRRHGSYQSGAIFSAHNTDDVKMRYVYNDGNAYSIDNPGTGYTSNTVGDIRFINCSESCPAPVVVTIDSTYSTLSLTISSVSDSLETIITEGLFDETLPATLATGSSLLFSDLTPSTTYNIGIRSLCSDEMTSTWTVVTLTTSELPCFPPTNLTVTATAFTAASLSWTVVGAEQAWEVNVYNTTFDSIYTVATNPNGTFDGLQPGVLYNARVRALCGVNSEMPGDWCEEIVTFTTDQCQAVTNVKATNITDRTAVISWNAATGTSIGYTVEYGYRGMRRGEGTSVTTATTSYTVTDLDPETEYDVYVQNNCGDGQLSNWSDVYTFTTEAGSTEGIDDVQNGTTVSLYPNPASTSVTVSLEGYEGEAQVSIVDMNGRTVAEQVLQGSRTAVDVSRLSQGAYFVKITGDKVNAIRKLIVR